MSQTGPKTAMGKYRSSLNSMRHGLTSRALLPCRKVNCYYWFACPCRNQAGDLQVELMIGDPCPIEASMYNTLCKQYSKALGGALTQRQCEDIHRLSMCEVRLRRISFALAINPEITRWVSGKVPGFYRPTVSLPIRYKQELKREWHAHLSRLFPRYRFDSP